MRVEIHRLIASVVRITAGEGVGTGFFVGPGRVLTCAHVIEPAGPGGRVTVHFGGVSYPATLVSRSARPYPDLALLQVDCLGHPIAELDEDVQTGDPLFTFGYSSRSQAGGEPTTAVCEGPSWRDDEHRQMLVKFKAGQFKHGVSGAPLVNMRTLRVCGVVRASRDVTSEAGGRAVPIRQALELFDFEVAFRVRRVAGWLSDLSRLWSGPAFVNAQLVPDTSALRPIPVQIHHVLQDTLRWAHDHNGRIDELWLAEALTGSGGAPRAEAVIAYQVNHGLTAAELTGCLNEIYRVYATTLEHAADTAARLRYRILCPDLVVDDLDEAKRQWAADQEEPDIARHCLDATEISRVADGHEELWRLVAESGFADPAATINQWVETLLGAVATVADLESMSREWTEEVRRTLAARPASPGFLVFTREHREPERVEQVRDGFLVGEQPHLNELVQGFFAPNEKAVSSLEQRFWSWTRELSSRVRVPVFFVTGASGSGKSVLLLQLLARLNQRPGVNVLWLGRQTYPLVEAVGLAMRMMPQRRVIIALDDPYMPGARDSYSVWRKCLAQLEATRQSGAVERLPIFVCCGPTDQAAAFAKDHGADLAIEQHRLGLPSDEDLTRLRRWFSERTGEAPPSLRPHRQLPIELFFEWWKREGIEEFATRFRTRLEGLPGTGDPMPLTAVVDRVTALNRLYVGYPAAALEQLTDESKDRLRQLEDDIHFAARGTERPQYWLTHAHLANRFFDAWHPPATARSRRNGILRDAFLDAVKLDDTGVTALPILKAMHEAADPQVERPGEELVGRLTVSDLASVIQAASPLLQPLQERLLTVVLASWLRAQMAFPAAFTTWRPLDEAVRRVSTMDTLSADVGGLLTEMLRSEQESAVQAALGLLERDCESPQWTGLMFEAVKAKLTPPPTRVLSVGILRLTSQERLFLLEEALRHWPDDPDLATAVTALLDREPISTDLARIAGLFCATSPAGYDRVRTWAINGDLSRDLAPAVAALVQVDKPDHGVKQLALNWAMRWPVTPRADVVLAALVPDHIRSGQFRAALGANLSRKSGHESRALEPVREWMVKHSGDLQWADVWLHLPAEVRDEEAMRQAAFTWLAKYKPQSSTRKTWIVVWLKLARTTVTADPALPALAEEWFLREESHPGWPKGFVEYLRHLPAKERPRNITRCQKWLSDNPLSNSGWSYLYSSCIELAQPKQQRHFFVSAFSFLRRNPEAQAWGQVWRVTLRHGTEAEHPQLLEFAGNWLTESRSSWAAVYRDYLPMAGHSPEALALGESWLRHNLADYGWLSVLSLVGPHLTTDQIAVLIGQWVAQDTLPDAQMTQLWRVMIEDGLCPEPQNYPELLGSIVAWLERNPDTSSWWHIWKWLGQSVPAHESVVRLALGYPEAKSGGHVVRARVRRAASGYPEINETALRLLAADLAAPSWAMVWRAIAEVAYTPRLETLGLEWLRAHPESSYWEGVWRDIWKQGDPALHSELTVSGLAWCARRPANPAWPKLWHLLFTADPGSAELVTLGEQWAGSTAAAHDRRGFNLVSNALKAAA